MIPPTSRFVRRLLVLSTSLGLGLLVTACTTVSTGSPTPDPGGTPVTAPGQAEPTPTPPGLSIVVDDGSGTTTTWQLSCDPPGGTHPDPRAACQALEANGATALPAVPKDRICTQVYGGSQTATITGTWRGARVQSRLSLRNGCEIARWKMLEGLLPQAGS